LCAKDGIGIERDARLLERAGRALAASLDPESTLEQAVAAFVPELADLCVIYSFEPHNALRVRAALTSEPELAGATARLHGQERPLGDDDPPFRNGRLGADELEAAAGNEREAELGALLGEAWRTTLPLRSREGTWGILVVLGRDPRPEPDESALQLMQELAERAGQALENARAHALATEARERFTAAFENAPIGMAIARAADGTLTEVNPALCAITGRTREQLLDTPLPDVYHPEQPASGERRHVRADGHAVWLQVNVAQLKGDEVVLQIQDISDRKRYESQLQFLADHDPLTGLFNRRRFAEELDWIVAYSRRYRTPAALIAIDIDNFKFVNDTFGHATGDELLVAIAEALRARCRESDIAGRLGGGEFGVILPQSGREEAETVARALLEEVRDHVQVTVGTRPVHATASIGVRLIAAEAEHSAEEILSDADIALYDAKEGGRDRVRVAGEGGAPMDRLRARIGWSERIRDALAHDGFELFEQPILHIASGRVHSSELLLRLRGDDGRLIAPSEFLETAERFGQIQAIDRWVIGRAVKLLAARQAAGLELGLEVNLSGGSISDASVIDFIVAEVRNAPIDPTRLTIEVTETAAIVNIERARALAQSLADLGCRFALDDFGSGFGSFYYLKHLPFDVVKIDGEFIKELRASDADRLTVQAIVQIARGLHKPTIAEFVETEPTLALLARLGVDYAQGYHVGRPRPVLADPEFTP
jgi:diguanylate cyclase (GGDEF)-like protein